MNRRTFLTALSTGAISGLAGCNALPVTDSTDEPTQPADSDLDGVPDSEDYAPWDDAVQNKTDVLDEYWGTPVSPEDSVLDETPAQSLFTREAPPTGRSLTATPGTSTPESMSTFVEYSVDAATVRLHPQDTPQTPFRLLVVAREFPRRGVRTVGHSNRVEPGTTEVQVSLESSISSQNNVYLSAFITPDAPLGEFTLSDVTYLHETNPFKLTGEEIQSVETDYALSDVSGDRHSRTAVEGGYVISLQGRSLGNMWSVAYFVSRSAYERKRHEPRGRRREEYVRYALSNGTGDWFVDVVTDAATTAGFTTRQKQAEFAIDMIQSLTYVRDAVSTGYDDYTKFIEETMVEIRGDCEDTTVALAVILDGLGYDVVLIEFPDHIGVGVAGNHEGSYISYDGGQYYYVETTSEGWAIGDIPEDLNTSDIRVSAV